jgi:2-(1,2-epoxy-1,2-dihydrophenyl)acetyl-CoA isomerase
MVSELMGGSDTLTAAPSTPAFVHFRPERDTAMTQPEEPVLSTLDEGVLVVRLNRPARLNAFDDEMLLHLGRAFSRAADDPEVRSVVLTGAGRAFCAGADLTTQWGADSALFGLRRRLNPLVLSMASLQKPLVAALHGAVAGAALGFAGVADVRMSARTAVYVPATATLGIVPDGGMTYSIPRLIGPGRAYWWLCGGAHINADQAHDWGLVDLLVEDAELMPRALELARQLHGAPGAAAALTKDLLRRSDHNTLAEQLELEHRMQVEAQSRAPQSPWSSGGRDGHQ